MIQMQTLKFKTNIKCGACIATVTPHLEGLTGLKKWEVDTLVADKVLTAEGDTASLSERIVDALAKAGYKAERI